MEGAVCHRRRIAPLSTGFPVVPLLLRIYALYNKSRTVLILMVCCLVMTAISMVAITARMLILERGKQLILGVRIL